MITSIVQLNSVVCCHSTARLLYNIFDTFSLDVSHRTANDHGMLRLCFCQGCKLMASVLESLELIEACTPG